MNLLPKFVQYKVKHLYMVVFIVVVIVLNLTKNKELVNACVQKAIVVYKIVVKDI